MGFQRKTFKEIVERMILWVRGNTTKLTNFDIGSKTRTLLEACAIIIEELYGYVYTTLKSIVEETIYIVFDFPRLPPSKATGTVTFKRNVLADSDYTIPIGTIISTKPTDTQPAVLFRTTQTVVLALGTTEISAPIEAEVAGVNGNVASGTIVNFVSKPVGIDIVVNSSSLYNGRDLETRDARRKRFREYIASRFKATKTALAYGAKEVSGVKDVAVIETPYVYACIDDGVSIFDISEYANDPFEVYHDLIPPIEKFGDCVYFGAINKFKFVYVKMNQLGVGNGGVWEYFNDTAWVPLPDLSDQTSGFTASGAVVFTSPADWKNCEINTLWAFWVRFRITEAQYTTTPQIGHVFLSPPPGFVEIYVDQGDGTASSDLLSAVAENLKKYRGCGISLNIKPPVQILVPVECRIKVVEPYPKPDIKKQIETAIKDYLTNFKFGENLMLAQFSTKITSIENGRAIAFLSIVSPSTDILVSGNEIIKPDTSSINVVVMN